MLAQACGAAVIDAGARVVCGGLGGIMEAAARGAHESIHYVEGSTIGILPGDDPATANPWIDVPIATGLGRARNFIVAHADAVVAIGGGAGTLSEIAHAWQLQRPIAALGASGWAGQLAGQALDDRHDSAIERLPDVAALLRWLEDLNPP